MRLGAQRELWQAIERTPDQAKQRWCQRVALQRIGKVQCLARVRTFTRRQPYVKGAQC